MVFVVIWLIVSQVLEMRLLGSIMDKLVSVGVIGLIVLFQEEIRHFLYNLGAHQRVKSMLMFFLGDRKKENVDREAILPIVMACMSMGRGKVGALIVMERGVSLQDISETGDIIDARIDQRLIENIFFKNSPLHDGAMGHREETNQGRRVHPSREPQPEYTQGTWSPPPRRYGNIAGFRCRRHCSVRGDGPYFGSHQGRVSVAPHGRAV